TFLLPGRPAHRCGTPCPVSENPETPAWSPNIPVYLPLFQLRVDRIFAFFPVARTPLVGLQRVEYTQHFFYVAAHVQVIRTYPAHNPLRVDNEGSAVRYFC